MEILKNYFESVSSKVSLSSLLHFKNRKNREMNGIFIKNILWSSILHSIIIKSQVPAIWEIFLNTFFSFFQTLITFIEFWLNIDKFGKQKDHFWSLSFFIMNPQVKTMSQEINIWVFHFPYNNSIKYFHRI